MEVNRQLFYLFKENVRIIRITPPRARNTSGLDSVGFQQILWRRYARELADSARILSVDDIFGEARYCDVEVFLQVRIMD